MDLDDLDDDYVKAPIEERGADVPDGTYEARIDSAILKFSKTQKRMLTWELVITDGAYKGRRLFRNNMLESPENLKWLKTDLHSCGLTLERLTLLEANLPRLIGVVLKVTAKTKGENQNVYINGRPAGVSDEGLPF